MQDQQSAPVAPVDTPTSSASLNRRDLLRAGAAAVALSGVAAAGLRLTNPTGVSAANAAGDEILIARNFAVDIPGLPDESANCFSAQIDPVVIPPVEDPGADPLFRNYAPGMPEFGNARFTFVAAPNRDNLRRWIIDAAMGQPVRKNITITLFKKDGSPARKYNLIDCFPVKWDPGDYSPSSNVVVEMLEVRLDRITME
jgi:phage tail-like protein